MDPALRDLLNQLGSELAGIIEDASANAALLPSVPDEQCFSAIAKLQQGVARAEAIFSAMRAMLPTDAGEPSGAARRQ